ncbi:fatty-acid--CoA ligase [Segetibacter aerophilus]|uniref:Fatty-acid--CoA ligase n=1 Tax=Segetibacter aerophilus TaxID=670293 RepID=A0A512B6E6_9BACT|nr:fatty-acid--CoA ligase [Segetibacter aerophilus]
MQDIPRRAAKKYGDKILFTTDVPCSWKVPGLNDIDSGNNEWSANKIYLTAGYVAALLLQLRVKHGDRIAIFKKNHFDIHVLILSIVRSGGIACPVNGKFDPVHFCAYTSHIGAKILIVDLEAAKRLRNQNADIGNVEKIIIADKQTSNSDFQIPPAWGKKGIQLLWLQQELEKVTAVAPEISREFDDPLYIVHSSGTTGFPKAVVLRNGKQSHAVKGWLCYVHISRTTDKGYLAVPNNHQAVILTFNAMLLLGFRAHWLSAYDHENFDAEKVIKELSAKRYTGFFGFPVTYTQLKEVDLRKYNLSRMRFWGTTADASHEVIMKHFVSVGRAFSMLGLPFKGSVFLDAQGSSEVGTPSVVRYVTRFTKKFKRRIGKPGSTPFGPEIRIITKKGSVAKRGGEPGRLEVKGKTVFDCYWNNSDLTNKAFTDNWFFTGDICRFKKDGHIVQLDREVDVIATANGDVYSLLIEEKIHKHPAVFDACVYGDTRSDGYLLPSIAVAVRKGCLIDNVELKKQLNQLLDSNEQLYNCDILRWQDFPIGVTGKTLKRVFRERSIEKLKLLRQHENNPHRNLSL